MVEPVASLSDLGHQALPQPINGSARRKHKVTRFSAQWTGLKKRMGAGTAPSSSSFSFVGNDYVPSDHSHLQLVQNTLSMKDGERVDEIVVDRVWSEGISSTVAASEHGATPEKSGGSYRHTTSVEQDSLAASRGFCASFPPAVVIRWKIWPAFTSFFCTRFPDPNSESRYIQETWFVQKVRLQIRNPLTAF